MSLVISLDGVESDFVHLITKRWLRNRARNLPSSNFFIKFVQIVNNHFVSSFFVIVSPCLCLAFARLAYCTFPALEPLTLWTMIGLFTFFG